MMIIIIYIILVSTELQWSSKSMVIPLSNAMKIRWLSNPIEGFPIHTPYIRYTCIIGFPVNNQQSKLVDIPYHRSFISWPVEHLWTWSWSSSSNRWASRDRYGIKIANSWVYCQCFCLPLFSCFHFCMAQRLDTWQGLFQISLMMILMIGH